MIHHSADQEWTQRWATRRSALMMRHLSTSSISCAWEAEFQTLPDSRNVWWHETTLIFIFNLSLYTVTFIPLFDQETEDIWQRVPNIQGFLGGGAKYPTVWWGFQFSRGARFPRKYYMGVPDFQGCQISCDTGISPKPYKLWTWDLYHWIQQRLRFKRLCRNIMTTASDLERRMSPWIQQCFIVLVHMCKIMLGDLDADICPIYCWKAWVILRPLICRPPLQYTLTDHVLLFFTLCVPLEWGYTFTTRATICTLTYPTKFLAVLQGHNIWQSQDAYSLSRCYEPVYKTSWSQARNSQEAWPCLSDNGCGHPRSHLNP